MVWQLSGLRKRTAVPKSKLISCLQTCPDSLEHSNPLALLACLAIAADRRGLFAVQSGFLDEYPFDPVGLNSEANQVKEIKNGRLAMVSPCAPKT